jgi:hypothetical protein
MGIHEIDFASQISETIGNPITAPNNANPIVSFPKQCKYGKRFSL